MYKDNQDRVDAYLRGEMDNKSRIQFDSDLKSDKILAKTYSETKAISDAIADRREKLNMMARWDKEEEIRQRLISRRNSIRRWTIGISVAACLSFGFFILKPLIFPSIPKDSFEMPLFSQDMNLYGENTGLDVLDSMINSKDFSNALAFADILIDENKQHIEHFNQTNSSNNEFDVFKYSKIDSIESSNSDNILRYEEIVYVVEWRRINLLLALDKKDECIEALNKFTNIDGIYKSEADSLLKKLSETTRNNSK